MIRYFLLQLKRIARVLPCILLVSALMAGGLYITYQTVLEEWNSDDSRTRLTVAAVGTDADAMLEVGFTALETMDSSRFSLELVKMDEQQAKAALTDGSVSAYVVFPEGFLEQALHGDINPIRFVSTTGNRDIFALLKDELTSALADILLSSEYGAFGLGKALRELGYPELVSEQMDAISLSYASLLLNRENLYAVEELGAADSMDMMSYMAGGILTILLFLMALPFASILIRDDLAVIRQLCCRGVGSVKQSVCEFSAFFLFLSTLFGLIGCLLAGNITAVLTVLPVALCISAVGYLLYSLCKDLISGALLYMIAAVGICFLSGCMYPIHFFPAAIQKAAAYLPAFAARRQLSALFSETGDPDATMQLVITGFVCFALAVVRNYFRLRVGRRAEK